VDVAAENELDSCGSKTLQHNVAPVHRAFVGGTPRRRGEMVMERRRS
jgi:hypothetical protein